LTASVIPQHPWQAAGEAVRATRDYAETGGRGSGWVGFARVRLLMLGTLNFIVLSPIGNTDSFVADTHYNVNAIAPLIFAHDLLAIYGLIASGNRIAASRSGCLPNGSM
jgi:hypothetical protein